MISVGSVLYLYIEDFEKKKYFIILGEDDENFLYASFYINTSINYNFVENTEMEKLHVVLKKLDYPFLSYDSYLNLTEPIFKSKTSIQEHYDEDNSCLVYNLTEEQLYFLRKTFCENPVIKGKVKKRYNFFEK